MYLSVADFAKHAKFVFSWLAWVVYGFALATKDRNHTAISHGCLTRSQVAAKSAVVLPILDCKYSNVEQKLLW